MIETTLFIMLPKKKEKKSHVYLRKKNVWKFNKRGNVAEALLVAITILHATQLIFILILWYKLDTIC